MTRTSYGEGGDAEVMLWTLADAVALCPAILVARCCDVSLGRRAASWTRPRRALTLLQTAHLAAEVSNFDGTDIQTRLDGVYLEACGCPGAKSGVVVHWGRWPAGRTSGWQAFSILSTAPAPI
jgi:hypothetical protein